MLESGLQIVYRDPDIQLDLGSSASQGVDQGRVRKIFEVLPVPGHEPVEQAFFV